MPVGDSLAWRERVDAALNNFVALHYQSRHMSWLHCFWGVGATLGPYVMGMCLMRCCR